MLVVGEHPDLAAGVLLPDGLGHVVGQGEGLVGRAAERGVGPPPAAVARLDGHAVEGRGRLELPKGVLGGDGEDRRPARVELAGPPDSRGTMSCRVRGEVLGVSADDRPVGVGVLQVEPRDEPVADQPLLDLPAVLLVGFQIGGPADDAELLEGW